MWRIYVTVLALAIAAGAVETGWFSKNPVGLPFPAPAPRGGRSDHDWRDWFRAHHHRWFRVPELVGERLRGAAKGEAAEGKDAAGGGKAPTPKWRRELVARLEPVLVDVAKTGDALERRVALVGLGRLGLAGQRPLLEELAGKDHLAAAHALVLLRKPQLAATFAEWASDKGRDMRLRTLALVGYGAAAPPQATDWLARFFDHEDKEIRGLLPRTRGKRRDLRLCALAGLALARRDDGFVELCTRVWHDRKFHEDVRAYALSWIGKRGGEAHLEDVLKAVRRERREQIRRSAALAAGLLAPKGDPAVAKVLSNAITRERNKSVRHFLAVSLGRVGGAVATKRLARLADRARKEDRGFFYLALGYTGHRDAVPILERAVRDAADEMDAAAAATGLLLHGPKSSTGALRERLKDARGALLWSNLTMILAHRRDEVALAYLKTVKSPPPLTSTFPARALHDPRETLGPMVSQLGDPRNEWERLFLPRVLAWFDRPEAASALEAHRAACADENRRERRIHALLALIDIAAAPQFVPLAELRRDMNYFIRVDALDRLFGDPLEHDSK